MTKRNTINKELGSTRRRNFLGQLGRSAIIGSVGTGILCSGIAQSALARVPLAAENSSNGQFRKPVQPAFDQYVGDPTEIRRLRLDNPKTGEKISVVYWYKGEYVVHGLHQIDLLLRDTRANEVLRIDVAVIDYLYSICSTLESNERIQILSGYRTQTTNDMLRKSYENVARNSLHIKGRAIDFRLPGHSANDLHLAARDLRMGGIGYYPDSGFVHIDSGGVRNWTTLG